MGTTAGLSSHLYRLDEARNGALSIWEWPREDETYTIGADCSGGGARGDFAAGVVLANKDCRLVALLHEQEKPVAFGRKLARLGWLYKDALLAIETFPAGYGSLACEAATNYGYRNVYTRIDTRYLGRRHTDEIGWRTDSINGDRMIGRVVQAIVDRYKIPAEELIQELWERRYDDKKGTGKPKIVGKGHDDLMDAYSIALLVRDEFWTRSAAEAQKKAPTDESSRFWNWMDRQLAQRQGYRRVARR